MGRDDMEQRMIGVVVRHSFNDYEIMLAELSENDSEKLWNIITPYAELYGCCGCRGDRNMTLDDCNITYLEDDWQPRYRSTDNPKDVVTISEIFKRYVDINGTHKGFEEYVDNGFMNGNEKEYEEV